MCVCVSLCVCVSGGGGIVNYTKGLYIYTKGLDIYTKGLDIKVLNRAPGARRTQSRSALACRLNRFDHHCIPRMSITQLVISVCVSLSLH